MGAQRARARRNTAAIVAGAVLVGGGIATAIVLNGGSDGSRTGQPTVATSEPAQPSNSSPAPSATQRPAADPSDPLTGGKVSTNEVIAVKVENIAAARPQVGLRSADIVFAEEVEGGQTRLLAVYHTTFPKRLGPVRSARSTDVELLPLFGEPGLVYSGANRNVQGKIERASIVPLERTTRDNSRVAPHNVFVNLASIADHEKTGKAQDIGWTFSADPPRHAAAEADQPKGKVGNDTFSFDYSGGSYVVKWRGRTYSDGDSGKTARTDNVVMMSVHNHPDGNEDVLGSASVMSDTVGRGKVTIYRDARKLTGTWKRGSTSGELTFTGSDGKAIALKPGTTWVLLSG